MGKVVFPCLDLRLLASEFGKVRRSGVGKMRRKAYSKSRACELESDGREVRMIASGIREAATRYIQHYCIQFSGDRGEYYSSIMEEGRIKEKKNRDVFLREEIAISIATE